MKLLELTDILTGTEKEYVEVGDISRIEPYMESDGLFSSKKLTGTTIYTKGGGEYGRTVVKQTPTQIAEMIKNKEYLEA